MTRPADPEITTEHIAVAELSVDPTVQRDLIGARVKQLRKNLDLRGIGTLTVSRRDDGSSVVLDGQHRVAALLAEGMNDHKVRCEVHHGLDRASEARLFRLLNNTRKASAFDDFIKGVMAGDPECTRINAIVQEHGLKITQTGQGQGEIAAVTRLRHLYRTSPGSLAKTLGVIVGAWGTTPDGLDGVLIAGIGSVFARYKEDVDQAKLIGKLAKRPGGPRRLVGDARGQRDYNGGTVPMNVARLVVDTYNKGLRTGQLPPL